MLKNNFISFLIFTFLAFSAKVYSQVDYKLITGVTVGAVDTLNINNAKQNSIENQGLIEKEIDVNAYIVGPGDEFTVTLLSANPLEFKGIITPDGNLIVPKIGAIYLKGKTLNESYQLVKEKVKKTYLSNDVYVALSKIKKFKVIVSGMVQRPNIVNATSAERVSEVIEKVGGFKKDGSLRNILILRGDNDNQQKIQVDLLKFYNLGSKDFNPFVQGGDQIIVYPINKSQSIASYGEIVLPNEFEFKEGDSLSTLINFSQGFLNTSLLDSIEFVRVNKSNNTLERSILDLSGFGGTNNVSNLGNKDFKLYSGDRIYVKKIANITNFKYVVISGEVKYPGKYAIDEKFDKVYDIITKCGGFLETAAIDKVNFIRQQELEIVDEELRRLEKLNPSEMSKSELQYFQAKIREKRGVMSIDFNKLMQNQSASENIYLRNKDSIIVPQKKDYINVQGRVNNPGNVKYEAKYNYLDYVTLAGGFGFRADPDETIITKPKGEQFLAEDMNYKIEPGDAILVPPKSEVTFYDVFKDSLTIATQLFTILGVVLTISRLSK